MLNGVAGLLRTTQKKTAAAPARGAMSLLDPIAAMLVSTDGRFDRTALDALIEQARFIPMARLSGVHQEHIMRQLEQLRSQPKLAGLIDEASGMVHHHVRPLMFFNGREVVERTDLARMVVAALFEIPRQRYIGSCWMSADKFSIHAAAPELFLQTGPDAPAWQHPLRRQRVRRAAQRAGREGRVAQEKSRHRCLPPHHCINHPQLKFVFDTLFGCDQQPRSARG